MQTAGSEKAASRCWRRAFSCVAVVHGNEDGATFVGGAIEILMHVSARQRRLDTFLD